MSSAFLKTQARAQSGLRGLRGPCCEKAIHLTRMASSWIETIWTNWGFGATVATQQSHGEIRARPICRKNLLHSWRGVINLVGSWSPRPCPQACAPKGRILELTALRPAGEGGVVPN